MRALPIIALLFLTLPAVADEAPRAISVAGAGAVSALPDRAMLSLGIEARSPDLAAARQQVSSVSAKFLRLSRQLGIPDAKVQTTGLNLRPEYRWDGDTREQRFVGYFVQRQLDVQLDDLELLGPLIEAAVDSGVNQVSPPVLDSSRRRDLEREALAAAALEARANATVLAETLGVKLGPVRQLDAQQNFSPPIALRGRAMAMEADSAADTYQAGEMRFEARVSAVFDILD